MFLHKALYFLAFLFFAIGCIADSSNKDLWMTTLGWASAAGAAIMLTRVVKDQ